MEIAPPHRHRRISPAVPKRAARRLDTFAPSRTPIAGIEAITPIAKGPYPQLSRRNDTSGMLTPRARPTLRTAAKTAK
ncbi:hypothetical protein PCAU_5957 [Pseudomonas chlororaphis subsp. aurantiaca]|nr:hypothetical protein PCAU_5957 [Pseudomonas chlororaphis subsp. aurantiaca]